MSGIEVRGARLERFDEILTPAALEFVARLHREFNATREQLLQARAERQQRYDAGELPDFLPETRAIREGDWKVAPVTTPDLQRRWVEITGPTERKMLINALNSGANVYMADFEDANTPSWQNMVEGHINLVDAIDRTISFEHPDGRTYRLNEEIATLLVRPRGWHLPEKHLLAYADLLVQTCHKRGAFAMGGMAAFIPSRRDPKVNEVALPKVRDDKLRESGDGFDGTWVAHPDLVSVAMEVFADFMGDRDNQIDRQRPEVSVEAKQLYDLRVPDGSITEAGLRNNVSVGIQYLASWLNGNGAAAIFNLMEDAATCEISRSQVWQWAKHGARLSNGQYVSPELVRRIEDEELARLREELGNQAFDAGRFAEAREIFEEVVLSPHFVEFMTLPAYGH